MPQVVLFAALGAGLYAGYRALVRAGGAMAAEIRRADEVRRQRTRGPVGEKDLGSLEYDPGAGVYRPRQMSQ